MADLHLSLLILVLLALAGILFPLYRRHHALTAGHNDRQAQNLNIYQQQLTELQHERNSGLLEERDYQVQKLELERNLLNDVDAPKADKPSPKNTTRISGWVLTLGAIVLLGSGGLYYQAGHYEELATAREKQASPLSLGDSYLLANAYVNAGRYQEASQLFAKIVAAMPQDQPQTLIVMAQWAQAAFFSNQGFKGEVEAILDRILTIDPKHLQALKLRGLAAFEKGELEQAVIYWQRAHELAQGTEKDDIQKRIEAVKARIAAPQASSPEGSAVQINLAVEVAPELQSQLSGDEIVFVIIRPVGQRMPIAVKRLQAKELPRSITLSDKDAMTPQAQLSTATKVEALARISTKGQATPSPGDLFATIEMIDLRKDIQPDIKLVINQVVQ